MFLKALNSKSRLMKKTMVILMALFLIFASPNYLWSQTDRIERGNLVIEGIPEIPQRIVERMFQYHNTRSASVQDWDPDGNGMLISTRFGETTQLHYIENAGGARRQITFFPEPVGGATMCPDPSTHGFLFTKDVGGSEFYQVFYFDLDNGQYKILTDGSSRNGAMSWSNKGDKFAYFTTKRNGSDWDICISDIKNPHKATSILEKGGVWTPTEWSPRDQLLLVTNYISVNESYYYIVDVESGNLSQINPKDEKIAYGAALWAKDGKGVYITSDEGSEFLCLKYYDLNKKEFTDLTTDIPWDVEQIEISKQGDKLAFITNEDGIGKLYVLYTTTRKHKQVTEIPTGQVYGLKFHPDGNQLALVINTPQTPGDIYVLDLQCNSLERWTYSEVGGLKTDSFVMPELIHYETFDKVNGKSRMTPAFYYKPKKVSGSYPVLMSIHGGPESQYVPYFSSRVQYYVNELGIAVLAPNVRGSSGYGKRYLKLDNSYQREDSVRDVGKLLNWIKKQPELDTSRVAVMGGSYGGYMALASMTHYNDRLMCGIDIVGISNFVTFLENTKEYRRDLRRAEYGDERVPEMREFLTKISPMTNVHKITKPMFIAQGLNDPRVPIGESEQMVSAIRKNGGTVWYLLAKDEGHGFRKKSNRDYCENAIVAFLEKYLLQQ
ncbi:Tol-Pal system protein TolB [subsurface metagenome]